MDISKIKNTVDALFSGEAENATAITCELADENIGDHNLHHCFACNMAKSLWALKKLCDTILNLQTRAELRFTSDEEYLIMEEEEIYRIFLPQIYLISEEIYATLNGSGLDYSFISNNLPFINRIRKLMNFLKHPKLKGFFKHPQYIFIDNSQELRSWNSTNQSEILATIGSITINRLQLFDALKFAKCDEKFFREKELMGSTYLKDKYLQETDDSNNYFTQEDFYDTSETKYYKLKQNSEEVFIYFSEADIKKYYSRELDNVKLEKLKEFCYLENLVIILPTISSLIIELKSNIEFVIKIYKENPLLFDEVSNFALTWVIEQ